MPLSKPSQAPRRESAPNRRRRIGLFGGSFDPVHEGHLHAARAALAAFDLDRVVFVPAAQSPFKRGRALASGVDRMAMLALAIADEPRFNVDAIELERGGESYTIDTVRTLERSIGESEAADLYLILGSDTLPGLPDWRAAHELIERVQPIVVHREGEPELLFDELRVRLGDGAADKVRAGYLHLPPVPVSSTELRARVARREASEHEIPPAVLAYIRARGMYGRPS